MTNQVQTLTLSGTPDSGSCDLTFGDCLLSGVTPANLATPSQIVSLLAAASQIFSSGVSASVSGLVDTFTFGPPVGAYDWPVVEADTTNLYIATPEPTVTPVTTGVGYYDVWQMVWTQGDGSGTWNLNVDGTDYACNSSQGLLSSVPNCTGTGSNANGNGNQDCSYLIFTDGLPHSVSVNSDVAGDDYDPSPGLTHVTGTATSVWQMGWTQGDGSGTWNLNVDGTDYACNSSGGLLGSAGCTVSTVSGLAILAFGDGVSHSLSIDSDVGGDDSDPNPSVSQLAGNLTPTAGVQTLTIDGAPGRGTFNLQGQPLGSSPAAADINAALAAAGIDATTSDNTSPYTITGTSDEPQPTLSVDSSTLGMAVTISASIATHGSAASPAYAPLRSFIIDAG